MAVANFMPQCTNFVFICVLTGFLQTAIIGFYCRYNKILTQLTQIWKAPVLRDHQKRRCHVRIGLPRLQTYVIGYYSDENWRMQGQITSGDGVQLTLVQTHAIQSCYWRVHCIFGTKSQWAAEWLQLIILLPLILVGRSQCWAHSQSEGKKSSMKSDHVDDGLRQPMLPTVQLLSVNKGQRSYIWVGQTIKKGESSEVVTWKLPNVVKQ